MYKKLYNWQNRSNQQFVLEILSEGLELAKNLEKHFTSNDPLTKPFEEFKKKLKDLK